MKIVVIGGTGLIGSKVVVRLRGAGHDPLSAAPSTGVNTVTGEGLAAALEGAGVVVDLANSSTFEPSAAMAFFIAHENSLLAEEARAPASPITSHSPSWAPIVRRITGTFGRRSPRSI